MENLRRLLEDSVSYRDESVARGVRIANLTQMAYVMRLTIAQALSASSGQTFIAPQPPPVINAQVVGGTDLAYEYARNAVSDSRQLIISLMAELLDSQLTVQSATNTITHFVNEATTFGQRDHSIQTLPTSVPTTVVRALPLPAPKVVRTIRAPDPLVDPNASEQTGPNSLPSEENKIAERHDAEDTDTSNSHLWGERSDPDKPGTPHEPSVVPEAATGRGMTGGPTNRVTGGENQSSPSAKTGKGLTGTGSDQTLQSRRVKRNNPHPLTLRLKNGKRAMVRYH